MSTPIVCIDEKLLFPNSGFAIKVDFKDSKTANKLTCILL